MRVKVRMSIDKPIMRGFTLEDDDQEAQQMKNKKKGKVGEEEEEGAFCRFEYEFRK